MIGLFERQREAYADVSAARNDDASNGIFEAAHLAHENANVLAVGDKENFVALLNDRRAVGQQRLAVAIDRRDATFGIRNMLFQGCYALADEQSVAVRFHADKTHAAIGKVQHLG